MDALTVLEKIDIIRERTGVGYAEAQGLLEEAGGDVVQALIKQEQKAANSTPQSRLIASLERLIHQGNITRLRVRKGERVFLEVPVTAGVIGAAIAPQLFLVAGVACLVGRCSVEFRRADDPSDDGWHAVRFEESEPSL